MWQHIKKQSHYFAYKICLVKAMVFPVVIYGCESWIIKRLSAKELMPSNCGDRLLTVPFTTRRSSQSFLKEINPKYSLEGLMLKLKLQCQEPTHWKRPWCWERLKAKGEGLAKEEWFTVEVNLSKLQETVKDRTSLSLESWRVRHNNWTGIFL